MNLKRNLKKNWTQNMWTKYKLRLEVSHEVSQSTATVDAHYQSAYAKHKQVFKRQFAKHKIINIS
jgi:hypothetical protein